LKHRGEALVAQNPDYSLRFFEDKDENEVIKLVTSTFEAVSRDQWLWKYARNPHFDRSLVFVAEDNGRIIGCMHYLPRELKITGSLAIKGALGADFAVDPDYRQRGVGSSILKFSRSSKALEKKGIAVTYGFVDYNRAGFYRRNIDSVIMPLSIAVFRKFFDTSPIEKRLPSLDKPTNEGNKRVVGDLRETNMSVVFRLKGIPIFTLNIRDGNISVDKRETSDPDLTIGGDPYFLESVFVGSKGVLGLVVGMLRGKIRIRGGLRKILDFYKVTKTNRHHSSRED